MTAKQNQKRMMMMNKEEWKKWKDKVIYWLFGEIKFDTRWKVLMYLIQMAAIIPLFYFVVISDDFKIGKECAEFQPLIQNVKNGSYVVVDRDIYYGKLKLNFTIPNIGNWTKSNIASPPI